MHEYASQLSPTQVKRLRKPLISRQTVFKGLINGDNEAVYDII